LNGLDWIARRTTWPGSPRPCRSTSSPATGTRSASFGKGMKRLHDAYRSAGIADVRLKLYPGGRHESFNETNRHEVTADFIAWCDEMIAAHVEARDEREHLRHDDVARRGRVQVRFNCDVALADDRPCACDLFRDRRLAAGADGNGRVVHRHRPVTALAEPRLILAGVGRNGRGAGAFAFGGKDAPKPR